MRPKQYLALRNILVEFFGTAALVYFANWSNLLYELKYLNLGGYGICYGLILSLMIYIGLDTSGGHFDPSVTLSYLSVNRTTMGAALPYMFAQFLGGAVAAFIIEIQLTPDMHKKLEKVGPLGVPTPDGDTLVDALIVETIAVMFIHLIRIAVIVDDSGHKDTKGMVIGAMTGAMCLAIAPFSGAMLNPARALGPLFVLDEISSNSQMLMAITPFVGCYLAMFIYKKVLISEDLDEELDVL